MDYAYSSKILMVMLFYFVWKILIRNMDEKIDCLSGTFLGSCLYVEDTKSHVQRCEIEFSVCVQTDSIHTKNDRNQHLHRTRRAVTIFCPGVRSPPTMMQLQNISVVGNFRKAARCQVVGNVAEGKVLFFGN